MRKKVYPLKKKAPLEKDQFTIPRNEAELFPELPSDGFFSLNYRIYPELDYLQAANLIAWDVSINDEVHQTEGNRGIRIVGGFPEVRLVYPMIIDQNLIIKSSDLKYYNYSLVKVNLKIRYLIFWVNYREVCYRSTSLSSQRLARILYEDLCTRKQWHFI